MGYTRSLYLKYAKKGIKQFNLLFSPEFLRESKALYDNLYPSRIIVGFEQGNAFLEEAAHTFARLIHEGALKEEVPIVGRCGDHHEIRILVR